MEKPMPDASPSNRHARLVMVRQHLDAVPQFPPPDGFRLRTFRPGDRKVWVAIHRDADRLQDVTAATFDENFGYDLPAMENRCFFLVGPDGRDVGTATAWYDDDFPGRPHGRVHWVCILRSFQGRGLAKPLMTAVLNRLARSHGRAYLTTSAGRLPAVGLYLKFGFVPLVRSDEDAAAWRQVARVLSHPALKEV
jgi:GNAT superfamily N-acetyltransferase